MDKDEYESRKAFAGEKKPSMKCRFVGHDYTRRGIYMLTMTVEGRRPLFGSVYGSSDDACAHGRLLMLSAWPHSNERIALTAYDCQQMNLMAQELSRLDIDINGPMIAP